MDITLFIPILRQILQVVGGYLIGHGYLDDSAVQSIIGIILNGLTLAWWLYDRWLINRRNAAVKELAKDAAGPAAVKEAVKNA